MTSNSNNGLITRVWGSSGWTFNHSVTFGYPLNPTEEQKQQYRNYFVSLGNVLPCSYCRVSYSKIISTGETELTDADLNDRESLTKWFYRVHNAVNGKLGVDYAVTYDDVAKRYESFRAKCSNDPHIQGCVSPLDYKAFSFRKLNLLDCPIITLDKVKVFLRMAKQRSLPNEYYSFIELAEYIKGDVSELKKLSSWDHRNRFCQMQIKSMRENAIPSIESKGPYKGTPTLDELKLIMFLCSNLNRTELDECHARCVEIIG